MSTSKKPKCEVLVSRAVADLGFFRRGDTNPLIWSKKLLFDKIFAENCIKMKEVGPRGWGDVPGTPPQDPPM